MMAIFNSAKFGHEFWNLWKLPLRYISLVCPAAPAHLYVWVHMIVRWIIKLHEHALTSVMSMTNTTYGVIMFNHIRRSDYGANSAVIVALGLFLCTKIWIVDFEGSTGYCVSMMVLTSGSITHTVCDSPILFS